jgi:hypothetical protein
MLRTAPASSLSPMPLRFKRSILKQRRLLLRLGRMKLIGLRMSLRGVAMRARRGSDVILTRKDVLKHWGRGNFILGVVTPGPRAIVASVRNRVVRWADSGGVGHSAVPGREH